MSICCGNISSSRQAAAPGTCGGTSVLFPDCIPPARFRRRIPPKPARDKTPPTAAMFTVAEVETDEKSERCRERYLDAPESAIANFDSSPTSATRKTRRSFCSKNSRTLRPPLGRTEASWTRSHKIILRHSHQVQEINHEFTTRIISRTTSRNHRPQDSSFAYYGSGVALLGGGHVDMLWKLDAVAAQSRNLASSARKYASQATSEPPPFGLGGTPGESRYAVRQRRAKTCGVLQKARPYSVSVRR